jgi:hypothetical protein
MDKAMFALVKRYRGRQQILFKGSETACAMRLSRMKFAPRPTQTKNYPVAFHYLPVVQARRVKYAHH